MDLNDTSINDLTFLIHWRGCNETTIRPYSWVGSHTISWDWCLSLKSISAQCWLVWVGPRNAGWHQEWIKQSKKLTWQPKLQTDKTQPDLAYCTHNAKLQVDESWGTVWTGMDGWVEQKHLVRVTTGDKLRVGGEEKVGKWTGYRRNTVKQETRV